MSGFSIAERLGEAARMVRSPLAKDLSGNTTAFGQQGVNEMGAILRDLPLIEARTPADALALASIAGDLLGVLAMNADPRNETAIAATFSIAQALAGLKVCLSDLAERPASDFAIVLPDTSTSTQTH